MLGFLRALSIETYISELSISFYRNINCAQKYLECILYKPEGKPLRRVFVSKLNS